MAGAQSEHWLLHLMQAQYLRSAAWTALTRFSHATSWLWLAAATISRLAREADLKHSAGKGKTRLMCGISGHDCRQRFLQSPRAVELADQQPRWRIQFCREGQPVLESEVRFSGPPAASREARVLGDDGVMDDAQSRLRSSSSESSSDNRSRLEQLLHVSPGGPKGRARQLLRLEPAVTPVRLRKTRHA